MKKVLFVCLGNICRSPLAEAILKKKVADRGLSHLFHIDSAGTANYHIGKPADARSRKNAQENSIEIDHQARQILVHDLEEFDYILAMDRSNYQHILRLSPLQRHRDKVFLMRRFAYDTVDLDDEAIDVPDPYYGGEEGFQQVFHILEESCDNFLNFLTEQQA